jgi:hypothetical protein
MGLLDIIRKPKPRPTANAAGHGLSDSMRSLASTAEFITACLLKTDLPVPQSVQDEAIKKANELAVSIFRNIYRQQGIGPSPEMSDALILDIYRRVGCAFREVAKERGEFIESAVVNGIVLKFLEAYRGFGSDFFEEHLQYEIQKYKREGLRADYSQNRLDLFG